MKAPVQRGSAGDGRSFAAPEVENKAELMNIVLDGGESAVVDIAKFFNACFEGHEIFLSSTTVTSNKDSTRLN